MLEKLFILSVFTVLSGLPSSSAPWCDHKETAQSLPKACGILSYAETHQIWTQREKEICIHKFLFSNRTMHSSALNMIDLRRSVAWDGNLFFSELSHKEWKRIWFGSGLPNNDPWWPHLYGWLYDIWSYFRDRWIFCSLHVYPPTASPLLKPVSSDSNSPNITTDLFKLRVGICLTGFEWVIAPKQLPKPTTPRPIQIWAIFKLFLVISEPC